MCVFFSVVCLFNASTFMLENRPTLLAATYSWPCAKISLEQYSPTFFNPWPCALFIVIAKHGLTGNCLRTRVKGNTFSLGERGILGMRSILPAWVPVMDRATSTLLHIFSMTKRDPLHCPNFWLKFLRSMTTIPTFSVILCGGRPDGHRVFRNSVAYRYSLPSSGVESALWKTCGCPGNGSVMISLTSSIFDLIRNLIHACISYAMR